MASKPKLPFGWEAKISNTFPDKVYYWNRYTRDALWSFDEIFKTKLNSSSSSSQSSKSNESFDSNDVVTESLTHNSPLKRKKDLIQHKGKSLLTTIAKNQNTKKVSQVSSIRRKFLTRENAVPTKKSPIKPPVISNELKKTKMRPPKDTIKKTPQKSPSLNVVPHPVTPDLEENCIYTQASTSSAFHELNEPESDMEIAYSISDDDDDDEDILNTDVEMTDIFAEVPKNEQKEAFRIVVDTNVLIHNIEFIDKLKQKSLQGCGPPIILIPWVVLSELDLIKGNKDNSKSEQLKYKAREATRYIREIFKEKPLPTERQNSQEKQIKILKEFEFTDCIKQPGLDLSRNDDRIAYCCLQLQKKLDKEKVILLSNDLTFLNLATALDIRCFKPSELLASIIADPENKQALSSPSCSSEKGWSEAQKSPQDELNSIIKISYRVLKDCLSDYLEENMKNAFGIFWESKIYRRPPWSLLDILECLEKHWANVFSFFLNNSSKESIEKMVKVYSGAKGYICDKSNALLFLKCAQVLLLDLSKVASFNLDPYIKRLTELEEDVTLVQLPIQVPKPVSQFPVAFSPLTTRFANSNLVSFGDRRVLPYLNFLWGIFNHNTGLVLDSLHYPHSYIYKKPSVLPKKKETYDFLPKLFPLIRVIRESLRRILYKGKGFAEEDMKKHLKTLHMQLKVAPKTLELETNVPELPELVELEAFCFNNDYRSVLIDAYNDVDEKLKALHDCIRNLKYDETD